MNKDKIIELIKKLLEAKKLGDEIKKKLEDLLKHIEEGEPTELIWARLLAEFIEQLGDKMPPVISDFIKAYATALKSGIGWAVYLTCIRYWMLREQGVDHESAANTASLDEKQSNWCRLLWNLHHLPEVEEVDEDDEDEDTTEDEDTSLWLPGEPSIPEGKTIWLPEHNTCCTAGGKDTLPIVNLGTLRAIRGSGVNTKVLSGTITISHPCGIIWSGIKLLIPGAPFSRGFNNSDTNTNMLRKGTTTNAGIVTHTYTFDKFPLAMSGVNMLEVYALSSCYTALPNPTEFTLV
ncbi:MAG: hypothetical protein GY787_10100 [Alteromonadales bacterium]|nr:hypothetical protein [Alteromonadales bacterium]